MLDKHEEEEEVGEQEAMLDEERFLRLTDPNFIKKFMLRLPAQVRDRVMALQGLQTQATDLLKEQQKEIADLELKYSKLYKPLFEERRRIVLGERPVTEEEILKGKAYMEKKAEEEEEEEGEKEKEKKKEPVAIDCTVPEGDSKGVPGFWLAAMKSHSSTQDLIMEWDEDALESLVDIQDELLVDDNQQGFRLTFVFKKNDFFTNESLTKEFRTVNQGSYQSLASVKGTEINWNQGKNLTQKTEKVKQKAKNSKQTRTVSKTVPQESFFKFFNTNNIPEEEEEA
eukprot:Sspe_Gene.27465::Locus_11859_Transcript_2_3_Confidence_0.625_Length_1180::g.27465::m.27465/K11279/NAP1L1, NRP; nucleosome assembly protein 1-like 1